MNEMGFSFLGFHEPVSSWTHLGAALYFLLASVGLVYKSRGNTLRTTSVLIYCFSIVFLLAMSGVYHLLDHSVGRAVLQRLDHAGIWTLIMGTFTPIHVILFDRFWRWGILFLVWSVGITGLVLEVVFFARIPAVLSLAFYLILGWVGVLSAVKCRQKHMEKPILFLVLGGLAYSVGALLDYFRFPVIWKGVIGPHEIFHFFVIFGIFFHWKFVYCIANLAITKRITFIVKVREGGRNIAIANNENIRFFFENHQEFSKNLENHLSQTYGNYRTPCAVRVKYIREDFFNLTPSGTSPVSPETFYER
ncbi:MAG: hemolysin III family protein [Deltaproteobacteria bacterium]|nr:hemolysin III family protein [Deltaproteobacteria bacterium]